VPEREENILNRLAKLNEGPFSNEAIQTVFREILSASLALESPLKVAYFGPEATFTHLAGIKRFGLSARFVPLPSIEDVFREIMMKKADYGVVPIENSTAGVVSFTLDLFVEYPLKISSEVLLPITHNLLSNEKSLKGVKKVYSHPHAFPQCRLWLQAHLPGVKHVDVASTAKAAEIAADEKGAAAIASDYAATLYGLKILARHIEDHPNNFTRFVVIGHQSCGKTGHDKTSVMFSTKDEVGVLYHLLAPLAKAKINLTKIESRPLKGRAWEYIFFVDMDGHQEDPRVKKALRGMAQRCSFLKVLGSYPKSR
jgi:chorismate mutase/prephenate dehydratase